MDLLELKDKLRNADIHPIHVEGSADPDEVRGSEFIGTLDEYFDALKALNYKAIFITTDELTEEHFSYRFKQIGENEELNEFEEIDLRTTNPRLEGFKKHIDKVGGFCLSSSLNSDGLSFFIQEDWWLDFMVEFVEAVEKINAQKMDFYKSLEEKRMAIEKDVIDQIASLTNDKNFRRLTTQRAMLSYAEENIPNIEVLDPKNLKGLIQKLSDKLDR